MFQTPILLTKTRRIVLAQVSLCCGCCCGAVEKGHPEVPVEWMKDEWKKRGLKRSIQLSISGCLGPCDLPNVVTVASSEQTVWLGCFHKFAHYAAVLEWASATSEAGRTLPFSRELNELRFDPFRRAIPCALVHRRTYVKQRTLHEES